MKAVVGLINDRQIKDAEAAILEEFDRIKKLPLNQLPLTEVRRDYSEEITETFFQEFQKMPSARVLSALSDFLLLDYLKNSSKKSTDENQFHSPSQEKYRKEREFPLESDALDYYAVRRNLNIPKKRYTGEKGST